MLRDNGISSISSVTFYKMLTNLCEMHFEALTLIMTLYNQNVITFFLFIHENICRRLSLEAPRAREALLMSTHDIYFHGERRKLYILTSFLYRAM